MSDDVTNINIDNPTFYKAFPEGFRIILAYECEGDYDGSGCAVAHNGTSYMWAEYSHCSCYGPEDNMSTGETDTLAGAVAMISEHDRDRLQAVS